MKTKILLCFTLLLVPLVLHPDSNDAKNPHGQYPPTISIVEVFEDADRYLKEKRIDVSEHFISAVRFLPMAKALGEEGPCWHITFELKRPTDGGQYFVLVFMNGKIGHLPGR